MILLLSWQPTQAALTEDRTAKVGPIELSYTLYSPQSSDDSVGSAQPALVLSLHGCVQDAKAFAEATHLVALADQQRFYVIAPNQISANNSLRCWNWFKPENQSNRSAGELNWLATVVMQVAFEKNIPEDRVFVVGLSAGAAMAANLLACFPNVFSGGVLHSGLEFAAAKSEAEARAAMANGPAETEAESVARAMACSSLHPRPLKVVVVHGEKDSLVNPVNATRSTAQFRGVNEALLPNSQVHTVASRIEKTDTHFAARVNDFVFADRDGEKATAEKILLKEIIVEELGHAWSGGSNSTSYMDPKGVPVSQIGIEFLLNNAQPLK